MSLLTEHAAQISSTLNYIQRMSPEASKRLCWAVTQGEYDALARETVGGGFEELPLKNLFILGTRVVIVPDLGEYVLR